MAIEDLASNLISQFALPAGAVGLATGLVRGATALEKDANPQALKYVSGLLTGGNIKNIGKASAGLVPIVFDKVFGPKPFSIRFISRSIAATTLFWLILLLLRHADWQDQMDAFTQTWDIAVTLIVLWYILDWLSLLKAKLIMGMISTRNAITTSFLFLTLDIILSYGLAYAFSVLFIAIYYVALEDQISYFSALESLKSTTQEYSNMSAIFSYFSETRIDLGNVIVPSTMLTSVWTLLLFVSCLLSQLLVPIDWLRRFTAFWFKDVEHKPLTAIAKVAATLIIMGAFAIKGVRWVYGSA